MFSRSFNSANTDNAELIRAGGTSLAGVTVFNAGGAPAYVKLYDKATAPAVGTDVPEIVIAVPATSTVHLPFNVAYRFSEGLGIGMVTGAADTNTTAVAAAQLKVAMTYGDF
jgi:hypothetical protein